MLHVRVIKSHNTTVQLFLVEYCLSFKNCEDAAL